LARPKLFKSQGVGVPVIVREKFTKIDIDAVIADLGFDRLSHCPGRIRNEPPASKGSSYASGSPAATQERRTFAIDEAKEDEETEGIQAQKTMLESWMRCVFQP